MTGPFPDTITPPTGLTRPRMSMGLPPWAWAAVFIGSVGPLFLFGKWGLICSVVSLLFGGFVAYEAHWDPRFLETWLNEMSLKKMYH